MMVTSPPHFPAIVTGAAASAQPTNQEVFYDVIRKQWACFLHDGMVSLQVFPLVFASSCPANNQKNPNQDCISHRWHETRIGAYLELSILQAKALKDCPHCLSTFFSKHIRACPNVNVASLSDSSYRQQHKATSSLQLEGSFQGAC